MQIINTKFNQYCHLSYQYLSYQYNESQQYIAGIETLGKTTLSNNLSPSWREVAPLRSKPFLVRVEYVSEEILHYKNTPVQIYCTF